MTRSGLATMLLLVLAAAIILLVLARDQGEVAALWDRLAPSEPDARESIEMPHLFPGQRPVGGGDAMHHVDQLQRDMDAMQDLSRSVGQ